MAKDDKKDPLHLPSVVPIIVVDKLKDSSSVELQSKPRSRLWHFGSIRFRIAIALALALSIEGLMRSNINMAMVCMVN